MERTAKIYLDISVYLYFVFRGDGVDNKRVKRRINRMENRVEFLAFFTRVCYNIQNIAYDIERKRGDCE